MTSSPSFADTSAAAPSPPHTPPPPSQRPLIQYSKRSRPKTREEKREAMKDCFRDPLVDIVRRGVPEPIAARHPDLQQDMLALKEKVRKVSDSSVESVGSEDQAVLAYVASREEATEQAAGILKQCRSDMAHNADATGSRHDRKRIFREIDDSENSLLRERAVLKAKRIKLEFGMLSHPATTKLGDAYFSCLASRLTAPSGAAWTEDSGRSSTDQTEFRRRLCKDYVPPDAPVTIDEGKPTCDIWCPVLWRYIPSRFAKAAHIVPYGIGLANAAYIFGKPAHDGWEIIWDVKNGLLLYSDIEERWDSARLVIVPDNNGGLKVVILDKGILNQKIGGVMDLTYGDIHNRSLQFKTTARPKHRYLFFNTILHLFRRRRHNVIGWENDSKMLSSPFWGSPGRYLRKSTLDALAFELGDIVDLSSIMPEVYGHLAEFPAPLSRRKENEVAVDIRYGIEGKPEPEDDGAVVPKPDYEMTLF